MKIKKSLVVMLVVLVLIVAGCAKGPGAADAPKFPTKSMDLTILFAAGTSPDLGARQLADLVQKDLGQPVVANNRVGGGGAVGYQYVLQQPADGYNMVWNSSSISTAYYQGNLPANQNYQSFRGVAQITNEPSAVSVRADARWQTIDEFIQYAKEHPGEVSIVNAGVGSFNHLTAVALEEVTGAKFNHVFTNQSSVTPLLGGQVDAVINTVADISKYHLSGQVRMLGVIGDNRVEAVKEVPTMKEQGIDINLMMYRGIAVPKDTPDDVVKILEASFMKAAQSEEFKAYAQKNGVTIEVTGAADFDKHMAEHDKQIAELMQKMGLKKQ